MQNAVTWTKIGPFKRFDDAKDFASWCVVQQGYTLLKKGDRGVDKALRIKKAHGCWFFVKARLNGGPLPEPTKDVFQSVAHTMGAI